MSIILTKQRQLVGKSDPSQHHMFGKGSAMRASWSGPDADALPDGVVLTEYFWGGDAKR